VLGSAAVAAGAVEELSMASRTRALEEHLGMSTAPSDPHSDIVLPVQPPPSLWETFEINHPMTPEWCSDQSWAWWPHGFADFEDAWGLSGPHAWRLVREAFQGTGVPVHFSITATEAMISSQMDVIVGHGVAHVNILILLIDPNEWLDDLYAMGEQVKAKALEEQFRAVGWDPDDDIDVHLSLRHIRLENRSFSGLMRQINDAYEADFEPWVRRTTDMVKIAEAIARRAGEREGLTDL
jgi:hypothetical protein